jgi:hypothetical protein
MLNTIINDIDIVLEAISNNDLQDAISMLTEIQQELIIIEALQD